MTFRACFIHFMPLIYGIGRNRYHTSIMPRLIYLHGTSNIF